jgi:outer membrane protein TolC
MIPALFLAALVAASPAPMTLAQALDFAAEHNQNVLAAKAQWVQAGATLARDRSMQLPLVSGIGQNSAYRQSSNYGGSFSQTSATVTPTFSQNTAELVGLQSIYNLQNELAANQERHAYDQAAQNLRLVKEQTTIGVETSYYTYVQDVQLVTLAQSDFAYQKTLLDIANANYKSGRVAGIDRLKAQVQVTSSQEALSSAQADAEDARQNLAQLIGADVSEQFVVPAAIPAPTAPAGDQQALNAIALVHRPEVATAQDGLSIAVLSNGLVDAPNRPTVSLQGGWGNQTSNFQRQIDAVVCAQANAPANCSATHFYTIAVTSQLSLPLLDWGSMHAAHNGAHAAIDQQTAALSAARRQAIIDVDQALRRLKVDEQNLALATQNADVAKQAAQIAQVQYKVGLGSQIDVTSAEQTYLQAAKQLLAAQVGYVLAVDKLKLATGTLVL